MARLEIWCSGRRSCKKRCAHRSRDHYYLWHYRVTDRKGRVVAEDSTGSSSVIFEQGIRVHQAFQIIERIGHVTKRSWPELVDGGE